MMSKRVERCLYCGMANAEGSKFCSNCSTPIGQAVPPQHQQPQQPPIGQPYQQPPSQQGYPPQQYQQPQQHYVPPPPPVPQPKKSPMAIVAVVIVAIIIFAAIGYFVTTGFPNLGGGASDPAGTVTTKLTRDYVLDFETGTVQGGGSASTGMDDLHTTVSGNFEAANITDVGTVSGLGAITSTPASGWVRSIAITRGHGYVVASNTGTKYRLYVTESDSFNTCTFKWAPMP